jgi:predicted nucleotidyltransferase
MIINVQIDRPFRLVTSTVDGDVLAVLALADAEFTPPHIHRLIGDHSVDGVRNALVRLTEQGIVLQRRAGMAYLYQLNHQHIAAPAISAIAGFRQTLIERIRTRLETWKVRAPYAALFGSAVGSMTPRSDIDIFVVRPQDTDPTDDVWREQLDALSRDVSIWTGNDARVLEYGTADVEVALARGDRVLDDIRDGGLRLVGTIGYLRPTRRRSN